MTEKKSKPGWEFLGEARTQILLWYVILMFSSAIASTLIIRQALFSRLEERIEASLTQETEEFQRLTKGRDPQTGERFAGDIAAIFDVFLRRNIPEEDEFLIALLNGKLYQSSPLALPPALRENQALLQSWASLTQREHSQISLATGETILYRAEPLIRGGNHGVFIVAYSVTGGRHQVDEAVFVIVQVTIAIFLLASSLAWVAAGRVLAPLRLLIKTVRSVSESDLSQRISVQEGGEIAELAITFNEMMDRLQSSFDSQRNFINDAGHELRTPITIVRGHLELMGSDPEDQQETLELVIDELDRMSRLVNDLLLLAKAERPDFLRLETVDIAAFTDELFAKAKALADRDWRLDSKGTGKIVVDRQRITEAVINLAQNATQHTQPGDVITLGSVLKRHQMLFWVRDTGDGIAAADQQRIFERFARAANGRHRSEGAGLGLFIVRAIAEAHHGYVKVTSELGRGSTFVLVLPFTPSYKLLQP
ncbi:MAG: HAMP domain-containing protein [Oscillatoriophycideae cyanobacterium NC_groundwater_1537_Pr4_S-0.65um_50_18]|nr:HAMP domain-containing protein [Oscillatoriophycideae cyanobacterium NC_groundwater_1537_Pr4_S-0.65um_50_18]